MRRPSLQFYPADWQANPKLRRCSHAEKGVWLDVLCILHDQDEYGIVRWPLRDIANAVHARVSSLNSLVEKGVLKGADVGEQCADFVYIPRHGRKDGEPVTLIKSQDGPIWYSSRMVRDEYVRQVRAANEPTSNPTPKGQPKAAPKLGIGAENEAHPSRARASSSSSSSSSSSTSVKKGIERPQKTRDARAQHPALIAIREVKGKFPNKDVWDLVIRVLGDHPDVPRLRSCWEQWRAKNYGPENLGWLVDWYVNGVSNNGSYQQNTSVGSASKSDFTFKPKVKVC